MSFYSVSCHYSEPFLPNLYFYPNISCWTTHNIANILIYISATYSSGISNSPCLTHNVSFPSGVLLNSLSESRVHSTLQALELVTESSFICLIPLNSLIQPQYFVISLSLCVIRLVATLFRPLSKRRNGRSIRFSNFAEY